MLVSPVVGNIVTTLARAWFVPLLAMVVVFHHLTKVATDNEAAPMFNTWRPKHFTTCALLCLLALVSNSASAQKLSKRPAWTTSRITGSPNPPRPYRIERVFPRLSFKNPVVLASNKHLQRWFVVEVAGKVLTFPTGVKDPAQAELACDLGKIKGMRQAYGLAFHPKFASNRYVYLSYVLAAKDPNGTRVSRFKVSNSSPPTIDLSSEKIIITWLAGGHNGACLQFGPDGYLYITSGDGGPAFPPDPRKSGQDVSTLLSAVMRINVDRPEGDRAYSIPRDNPFVKLPGARGEIWAYGFRNPWKLTFDQRNGAMWIADVGWEMWEMIYRVERGGNYGWSLMEGPQRVHRERTRGPTPILPATVAHSHTESRSITGGHVSYTKRLPKLTGAYVYGDYVTGKIWGVRHDGKKVTYRQELVDTPIQIVCFGSGFDGEVLPVAYSGTIHRLIPNPQKPTNKQFPQKLSATGLYEDLTKLQPSAGVVTYEINAEPWLDGAKVQRLVGLPGNSQLDTYRRTNVQIGTITGKWKFPTDGILARTISIETVKGNPKTLRKLETQVLHYDGDTWQAYNYVWNKEQTDALLDSGGGQNQTIEIQDKAAPGGKRTLRWHHASRSECLLCHTTRAGSIHGFIPEQLSRSRVFSGKYLEQLEAFDQMGLFKKSPSTKKLRKLVDPYDKKKSLTGRARAYLHVNCGHCHRRGGGGTAAFDVRHEFPLKRTLLLDQRPTQGTFGIHSAKTIVSGDPTSSVLLYRMMKLGRGRMPHFGSEVVDQRGVDLMYRWIKSLDGKNRRISTLNSRLFSVMQIESKNRGSAIRKVLSSTNDSIHLAYVLSMLPQANTFRKQVVAEVKKHEDVRVRDLFDQFLPSSARVQRLGSQVRLADIIKLKGDPAAGRKLFLSQAGVACKNCHQVKGQGKKLGPDLSDVGKRLKRSEILTSILQPSKKIDPKFQTYLAETTSGKVYTGLIHTKNKTGVVLLDATGKQIKLAAKAIDLLVPQQKSLMPELLFKDMTARQLADLLAYLSSLK